MFYRQVGLARDPFWRINAFFDLKNLVSFFGDAGVKAQKPLLFA